MDRLPSKIEQHSRATIGKREYAEDISIYPRRAPMVIEKGIAYSKSEG
jgi:hypothetical protein